MPKLEITAQQREELLDDLHRNYSQLSLAELGRMLDEARFEFSAGSVATAKSFLAAESGNPDLDTCHGVAQAVYEGAIGAAEKITNGLAKIAARTAAKAAYAIAKGGCEAEFG